jgi:hypothetical protein
VTLPESSNYIDIQSASSTTDFKSSFHSEIWQNPPQSYSVVSKSINYVDPGLTKPGEVGEIVTLYRLKPLSLDYKAKLKSLCFFHELALLVLFLIFFNTSPVYLKTFSNLKKG